MFGLAPCYARGCCWSIFRPFCWNVVLCRCRCRCQALFENNLREQHVWANGRNWHCQLARTPTNHWQSLFWRLRISDEKYTTHTNKHLFMRAVRVCLQRKKFILCKLTNLHEIELIELLPGSVEMGKNIIFWNEIKERNGVRAARSFALCWTVTRW